MDSGSAPDDVALARADLELIDALVVGDQAAVEAGLRYLEADPWRFRSGYVKQRILSCLRRYELNTRQRGRLSDVLLRCVEVGERWEFSEACKTAKRFQSDQLRDELVLRLYSTDLGIGVRATRMVTALRHPRLSSQDLRRARELLLRWADERQHLNEWTGVLVRKLWSPEWAEDLLARTEGTGTEARAAERLLELVM